MASLVANHSVSYPVWHQVPTPSLGKRVITVLESLPVIRSIIAFIRRVWAALFGAPIAQPVWKPRHLSLETAFHKMFKNECKAIQEHKKRAGADASSYADINAVFPEPVSQTQQQPSLSLAHTVFTAQGVRPTMEDADFYTTIEQGQIAGICDGHGGADVARYAAAEFQKRFSDTLRLTHGNVHEAFEQLIDQIHQEVVARQDWKHMGCTALFCFIDKKTNLVYTATLGDSEANIYRKIGHDLKSIPLSCIRDWSSPKDALRAAIALDQPMIAYKWPKFPHPKLLRFPSLSHGVNVARCIGDAEYEPGVSHKPKITVNQLKPGDTLILACDGLKDFVSERDIIALLSQYPLDTEDNLARRLVQYALNEGRSTDNVSVLTIHAT